MTADEALALAKFQRPGVRLIVGATGAREERTTPADLPLDWRSHEPCSFWEYDLRKRLGFIPSPWAQSFAAAYWLKTGREPTDGEYRWLHDRSGSGASLAEARQWIASAPQGDAD